MATGKNSNKSSARTASNEEKGTVSRRVRRKIDSSSENKKTTSLNYSSKKPVQKSAKKKIKKPTKGKKASDDRQRQIDALASKLKGSDRKIMESLRMPDDKDEIEKDDASDEDEENKNYGRNEEEDVEEAVWGGGIIMLTSTMKIAKESVLICNRTVTHRTV